MDSKQMRTLNSVSMIGLAAFALILAGLTIGGNMSLTTGSLLILETLTVMVLVSIYAKLEED